MDVAVVASFILALLAAALCLVGDLVGALPAVEGQMCLRAVVDNLTHGLVGAASWGVVVVGRLTLYRLLSEVLLAGFLAMMLDIDHFLIAGSFEMRMVLSLPKRPPFHATSIIPVITLLIWLLPRRIVWLSNLPPELPWLFFVSWLSHHIRDATRRGLWFWPFGSTPALPTWIYLGSIMVLPLAFRILLVHLQLVQPMNRPADMFYV